MASREVSCDDRAVEVLRWLRPNVEVAAGAMVPFLVAKADAQFVRDHAQLPWVLRAGEHGWSLEIVTVESTGTDGVWVSARAVSRIVSAVATDGDDVIRSTLNGIPVPGTLDDDT